MSNINNVNDFKHLLKEKNLKNTKHRNSILEVIQKSSQPIDVETIYIELKKKNVSISLSTVYRVLNVLVENGIVNKTNIVDENKSLYEINTMEHKHHLLCTRCRKMLIVDGCPLEEYQKAIEEKLGFSIKGHKLEMYGLCDKCKKHDKK